MCCSMNNILQYEMQAHHKPTRQLHIHTGLCGSHTTKQQKATHNTTQKKKKNKYIRNDFNATMYTMLYCVYEVNYQLRIFFFCRRSCCRCLNGKGVVRLITPQSYWWSLMMCLYVYVWFHRFQFHLNWIFSSNFFLFLILLLVFFFFLFLFVNFPVPSLHVNKRESHQSNTEEEDEKKKINRKTETNF